MVSTAFACGALLSDAAHRPPTTKAKSPSMQQKLSWLKDEKVVILGEYRAVVQT